MREIFYLLLIIVGFAIIYVNQENNRSTKSSGINEKRDLKNTNTNSLNEKKLKCDNDQMNEYRKYDKAIFVVGTPGYKFGIKLIIL